MGMQITVLDGNVGGEVRKFESATPTKGSHSVGCSFSLAGYAGKDRESGEYLTQWFDVKAFGWLAEKVLGNIGKGSKCNVVGRLEVENYVAKDGTAKSKMVIIASEITKGEKMKRVESQEW